MDAAEKASAAIERKALKRVDGIYNAALKNALADQSSFLAKIADVDAGRIKPPAFYDTPAKVLAWRQGFTRELLRKEKVIEGIKAQLNAAGAKAAPVIKGAMTDVYAANRTFTAEGIASQVNISFAQYDKRQIDIILNNSQSPFSKIAYKGLGANPAIVRRLNNEMAQAIIGGESQRDIVKRIREVTGQSKYQATRVAQTERTRIQSQARADTLTEAEALGVKTTKEWSARMVNTRDTHAALDGVTIPQDEAFILNDGDRLMYPGDPNGSAKNIINCRCVLIPGVAT
jgi:SPP1 gp7 family putative phage head morphogenesis protein